MAAAGSITTSEPPGRRRRTALRRGAFDLALGNIPGSNSFNRTLLLPLDLAHPGSLLAAVSPTHAVLALVHRPG